ncbi:MAG TPA: phage tail tape measure protein [Bilophila wadsworthia]|uniref:phage tail tape measure protein n=1 Tax=Bilophila wadsworthia TaxID=35833 RepID=UPI001D4E735A|nr:phage tail tape measure protein [Bilophila wadsworthia]HJH14161.1 phage tail tape measure protein [Bilophila wadsworthia]
MNAGELVVSLILSAGTFLAEVRKSESAVDNVRDAAREAGKAVSDAGVKGAQGLGQSVDAASSLQAAFDEAVQKGREISEVTKEYQRMREELIRTGAAKERLEALDDAAKKLGVSLEDAADKGAFGFERLKGVAAQALAVIGGVSILKSSIAQYYEQAQAIEKTSDALGMSIEDWQAWQRTAAAAGVDAEELSTRFMDLGDWMQDLILHDSGPLKDATKDLGVSFTDAKGKAVSFEEGLLRLSDATSKIDRQKATSILTQIGFDEKTIPLILKGRKGIEDLLKVQKAQAIYSKQDIENAKKQREAQQRLNDAWEAISALFASTVSPAITFLTDLLGDLLGWVKENKQFVILFFTGLAGVITTLMLPALTAMATAAWAAIAPFTPLIAAIGAIALVIDDLITYINGGESALSGLWSIFGTGDEIGARFKAIWEGIKSTLGGVWDALSGVAKLFNSVLTLDGKGVIEALKTIWGGISKINDVLVEMLNWVAQKLYNLLPDWIKDWLGGDESSRPEETKAEAKPGGVADSMRVGDVRPSILPPQVRAGDARPGSVSNVTNTSTSQTVFNNDIEIVTQATDGQGVANELNGVWRNQTFQSDGAYAGV